MATTGVIITDEDSGMVAFGNVTVETTGGQGEPGDDGIGLNWINAGWDNATAYAVLDALLHNGSSYRCIVPHTGQEPPNATYWVVVAEKGEQGESSGTGPTGPAGPGYVATSTSSLAIATGSKTFTTQAGLAYTAGARARAASAANVANWMEGIVSSYSSTTLIVTVDLIGGSGTHADWNINIAGTPGESADAAVSYEFDVTGEAYGAVGDGATDDSASIQACVTAAAATGTPQFVYIPPGIYMVQDPTDGTHSGQDDGPIRIEPGESDITIWGYGATLLVGPNAVSSAVIRIFGSRCRVMGLTIDADCDLDTDSAARKLKGSSGIEINANHSTSTADDALDCVIKDCIWKNGYRGGTGDTNGDDTINQGCEGFSIIGGTRCSINNCIVTDSTWQGYRAAGNQCDITDCKAFNFRGNGIRVVDGESLTITRFRAESDRCHGRSGILCDAASDEWDGSGGTPPRNTYVTIVDCEISINPDGTGLKPSPSVLTDGAGSTLKVAAADKIIVRGGYFFAGNATDNYAVRIEDCLREVIFEDVRIYPNVIFTPADNDESSLYQGNVVSIADNGSGKCRITLEGVGNPAANGGIDPGKSLFINGSTEEAYNREHFVQEPKVSDYVIDTDIDYVSGTIGSACFARSGVDIVRFHRCHFGGPAFGVDGGDQLTPFLENACCRILEIQDCKFDQLGASTTSYNGIDWLTTYDYGFDLIRIVDNDWNFNTDAASSHVGRMINSSSTTLVTSGKVVSYNNRLQNLGAGGAVLANSATANYNRQILFSTEGECKTRFLWTTPPNTGDSRTVFNPGDVITQKGSNFPGKMEWMCTVSGVSGSSASSFAVRDASYKFLSTASGTAVADFDANEEVSATPSTGVGSLQFGATRALVAGEAFKLVAAGTYSTTGTPTLNFGASVGKSQIGNGAAGSPVGTAPETGRTKIAEIGAFTTPSGAASLRWRMEATGVVKTVGASGPIQVMGKIMYETAADTWTSKEIGPTDVAVNTSNTSHNRKLDVWAAWGTKNASNTFTCTKFECMPL